jgi:hypothetical protein
MENFAQTEPAKPHLQWPFVDKIPEYQIYHKLQQSYPPRVIYHLKVQFRLHNVSRNYRIHLVYVQIHFYLHLYNLTAEMN